MDTCICKVLLLSLFTVSGLSITPPAASQGSKSKIWTIAIGHDWGAHEYIDTSGYLAGFSFDLIREVCKAANIECRTMWDKYTNCFDSEQGQRSHGGTGLMSGWYDACTGWSGTLERMSVFDFSMPFFPPSKVYFYKKKGNPFDTNDITGKKIGFQDGYKSDETCLNRQNIKGTPLPAGQVTHYATTAEMISALINNQLDAIFQIDFAHKDHPEIEKIEGSVYSCAISGNAMMTRKDNEFNAHWNRGFQQIVSNGRFRKLCKEGREKHGDAGELSPCV